MTTTARDARAARALVAVAAAIAFCWAPAPSYGDVPPAPSATADALAVDAPLPDASAPDASAAPRAFRPADVAPMSAHTAGDGVWTPVAVDGDGGAPILWKTRLHPDPTRSGAELFVAAIDLPRVRLRAMAGSVDPEAETASAKGYARRAMIPPEQQALLVAAFDGGWKAEHGHYGMKVDGVTLLAPREGSCTIAAYDDDTLRIAPWKEIGGDEPRMRFYRQTPACLYAHGARHAGLAVEATTNWGAAVGGDPVIRRSAIGLDAQRAILFVGVSNATTAPALADGMHHAGASDVAALDVNWSYPKVLVFHPGASGAIEAQGLFPGFVADKDEYLRRRSPKDFFYVVRRAAP